MKLDVDNLIQGLNATMFLTGLWCWNETAVLEEEGRMIWNTEPRNDVKMRTWDITVNNLSRRVIFSNLQLPLCSTSIANINL